MDIKDVKLKKGMSREEVNELIGEWIELEDEVYLGTEYKHNWKCKCGNLIKNRIWYNIRKFNSIKCFKCSKQIKKKNLTIKEVDLKPGMNKDEINERIYIANINLLFNSSNSVYENNKKKYNWICECGNEFSRNWSDIKNQSRLTCGKCNQNNNIKNINDVVLEKQMGKKEVNDIVSNWLILIDDFYICSSHNHKWRCNCGENFYRSWGNIKSKSMIRCNKCTYNQFVLNHKISISKSDNYKYINSYFVGDRLPNNKLVERHSVIEVEHLYCGNHLFITSNSKTNKSYCENCCGSYENSFAHYIEVELGEQLEKYWDFEKNTLNPYHIWKNSHKKIWIKCINTSYHNSYEITGNRFISNVTRKDKYTCPYCSSKQVHPRDSFAQYHIDNTDKDFLNKYWDYEKNVIDPFNISKYSRKKVWIKCQEKDYHGSSLMECAMFTNKIINNVFGCLKCNPKTYKNVHPYDSFGYHNFDKVQSWHPDNNISPFRVSCGSNKKFKFICETCGNVFKMNTYSVSIGRWCPKCNKSKGEKSIVAWLDYNNTTYTNDKIYFEDLIGVKGGILRPDFILPDHKIWIEYDGEFHYKNMVGNGSLETQKYHDKLKNEYAEKHGWKMIRIPYWEFDNIEEILEKEIIDKNKSI